MAAFNRNSVFDGDDVHKATSIHLQIDVKSMLDNLPVDATVYVQNENELEAVGATNNLRGLAANIKFTDGSVPHRGNGVKHSDRISSPKSLSEIEEKYKKDTKWLFLRENGNDITISNMVVKEDSRGKGIGTNILQDVLRYADKNGKRVLLTPTSEYGTKTKLTKWYKRFGFVENKGKNRDFTTLETMIREPNADSRVMYSDRDSNGRTLTREQQNFFEDSEIKEEPSPNVTTNKSPDIAYESSPENRVPQQATEVKENVRYSSRNQTESDNFKRWFGDWQNDPANASKVMNANGTPKQLYRYTNLEDTVIKPDYRGAIWMADDDWVTRQYGNRYDVLYANMRNPYVFNVDGLDFSEETALVNARKGGHDGLIIHFKFTGENNDYYQFIVENAPNTDARQEKS